MKIVFLLISLFFVSLSAWSQELKPGLQRDSTRNFKSAEERAQKTASNAGKKNIQDYKIIHLNADTVALDTALTIQKEYEYNHLRKDLFELLPFSNEGQAYNSLAYQFRNPTVFPQMGASGKHFNYLEVEDVPYYYVPTPLTDLFFKTTMEQGQILDAMFTINTSPQFNMSIAYRGLRSLGKYRNILASNGNFRFSTNYSSKHKRYSMKAHWAAQDLLNQENGGIIFKEEQFESGNPEFFERAGIDVNLTNAENFLLGKRYFLDHGFAIIKKNDSLKNSKLTLLHRLNYETKIFEFRQNAATEAFFGDAFQAANLKDQARLKTFSNTFGANLQNNITGNLTAQLNFFNYNYYFNGIVITDNGTIPNRFNGTDVAFGAQWQKQLGKFGLHASASVTMTGNLGGTGFNGEAFYRFNPKNSVTFGFSTLSKLPNFNMLLYQSDYENYNWNNLNTFENEKANTLHASLQSHIFGKLEASYHVFNNFSYFNQVTPPDTESQIAEEIAPEQFQGSINYLKIKYIKEFKLGKFALNNTLMYQNVTQDSEVLNLPQWVTRNTLYYSNHVFKKAMFLQTGVTFNYFTSYYANGYSPLLAEFYSQQQEKIGGFPLLDFFINAKVRQTRIYLKAEHFNSSFTGYNYYSAPNYPYRDFIVRFGLIWNFLS